MTIFTKLKALLEKLRELFLRLFAFPSLYGFGAVSGTGGAAHGDAADTSRVSAGQRSVPVDFSRCWCAFSRLNSRDFADMVYRQVLGTRAPSRPDDETRFLTTLYAIVEGLVDPYSNYEVVNSREARVWLRRYLPAMSVLRDQLASFDRNIRHDLYRLMYRRIKQGQDPSDAMSSIVLAHGIVMRLGSIFVPVRDKGLGDGLLRLASADPERLKHAEKIVVEAVRIGGAIRRAIESSRRLGHGFVRAHIGKMSDLDEVYRMDMISTMLLKTELGKTLLATSDLYVYKTYSLSSTEREGRENIKRLGIVIDVSGSMELPVRHLGLNAIDFACAVALALVKTLRPRIVKIGTFDVDFIEHDIGSIVDAVDFLLRLKSSMGGTDVSTAYRIVRERWRDSLDRIIIITDGADYPPPEHDRKIRFVILDETCYYSWGWSKRQDTWLITYKRGRPYVKIT